MAAKKSARTSKAKPKAKSSRSVKDLAVKRSAALKGGLYRRSDPCTGEPAR